MLFTVYPLIERFIRPFSSNSTNNSASSDTQAQSDGFSPELLRKTELDQLERMIQVLFPAYKMDMTNNLDMVLSLPFVKKGEKGISSLAIEVDENGVFSVSEAFRTWVLLRAQTIPTRMPADMRFDEFVSTVLTILAAKTSGIPMQLSSPYVPMGRLFAQIIQELRSNNIYD